MVRDAQRGIGLIEILLVLAVSAVILVLATTYYKTTNQNQKINETVSMVGDISNASEQYAKSRDFNPSSLNIQTLQDAGLLSAQYSASPWGSPFNVSANVTGTQSSVLIGVSDIPEGLCQPIADRLSQTMTGGDEGDDCSGDEYACCSGSELTVQYMLF